LRQGPQDGLVSLSTRVSTPSLLVKEGGAKHLAVATMSLVPAQTRIHLATRTIGALPVVRKTTSLQSRLRLLAKPQSSTLMRPARLRRSSSMFPSYRC
jgi:hypothetical protein